LPHPSLPPAALHRHSPDAGKRGAPRLTCQDLSLPSKNNREKKSTGKRQRECGRRVNNASRQDRDLWHCPATREPAYWRTTARSYVYTFVETHGELAQPAQAATGRDASWYSAPDGKGVTTEEEKNHFHEYSSNPSRITHTHPLPCFFFFGHSFACSFDLTGAAPYSSPFWSYLPSRRTGRLGGKGGLFNYYYILVHLTWEENKGG
jgi:hypothetical protein